MIIEPETIAFVKRKAKLKSTSFLYTEHIGRGQTDYINLYMNYLNNGKTTIFLLNPVVCELSNNWYKDNGKGIAVQGYAKTHVGKIMVLLGLSIHTNVTLL